MGKQTSSSSTANAPPPQLSSKTSEFNSSLNFLKSLKEIKSNTQIIPSGTGAAIATAEVLPSGAVTTASAIKSSLLNKTIKYYKQPILSITDIESPPVTVYTPTSPNIQPSIADVKLPTYQQCAPVNTNNKLLPPQPPYGCLKNGKLPTYRTYTRKHQQTLPTAAPKPPIDNLPLTPLQQKMFEFKSKSTQPTKLNPKTPKPTHQKRTIRRTYFVGKSKLKNNLAVLISNKTIRNHFLKNHQEILKTPIGEIKKYLIQKGFIRVGTIAPTDVLRKMYESARCICGEIENHNSDNLLYNFMRGDLGPP
jgi:hypothetical protein